MRKSAISAAAVLSSVALLSVGATTVAQAAPSYTQKELTICWVNQTLNQLQDLEMVADGPSYKTASLDAGDCVSYDVQPGQYKMTVEDMEEFQDALAASFGDCNGDIPDFRIVIKRMGDSYKAYDVAALLNGEVTTNVKKNRSTWITAEMRCL